MSSLTTFIQIILLVVAIGIGLTYLKPTFEDIQGIQDDIAVYENEIKNVAAVNAGLELLYQRVVKMDTQYKKSLYTYLPDEIDELSVLKDIITIAEMDDNLTIIGASPEALETEIEIEGHEDDLLVTGSFMIELYGPYDSIKQFLRRVEKNNYQLMVSDMTLQPSEVDSGSGLMEDIIQTEITFVAFALPVKINNRD
ncbi:hypothetical protein KC723_02050 [Candidatus Kaiserbacteria bacterium]|nr:hypothetical protein [Candidatus Kaiserbacteria bacterium]